MVLIFLGDSLKATRLDRCFFLFFSLSVSIQGDGKTMATIMLANAICKVPVKGKKAK